MTVYSVPAQDELESSIVRDPLPGGEDYKAIVLEANEATKPNFDGVMADVLTVKFDIVSFADGAPLEDTKGVAIEGGRWVWKDIDPKRMGFQQNGTASMARQFFAAVSGQADLTARIEGVDSSTLPGREVILSLVVKPKKDGTLKNNIIAIKPLGRRRGQAANAAPVQHVAAAEVSPEYAAAVASLVTGEDNPSAETVGQFKGTIEKGTRTPQVSDDLPF